jgi:sarcosine oxidase, subunit gamma
MVTAPFASHEDISGLVKAAAGDTASVTEQTDGWVRFELEGPRVNEMFERLCAIDVRTMQGGQATRTVIEHLGAFVLCQTTGRAFSVLTMRSAAASMHHALVTAAKSLT